MPAPEAPAFLSPPSALPTDEDLNRLTSAIETVGQENGFSGRRIDRYRAWTLVFVSWCLKTAPHCINQSRIGDFWRALRQHPKAGGRELGEAMDALGFLFGALGGVDEYFSYGSENTDSDDAPNPPSRSSPPTDNLDRHLPAILPSDKPDDASTSPSSVRLPETSTTDLSALASDQIDGIEKTT
jgi:hypothetical protein